MKKKLSYLIILLMVFIPYIVKANSISSISMDIYIDNLGNGHVTEVWSANLNEGTEGYKPYYNLGNASITDFKVSENGKEYESISYWNVNASFSDKAYKSGINYIDDGLELCWGISEYGSHKYTLNYTINGFVAKLNDSDMVYWNLIPYELSSKPSNVNIKIYADEKFSDKLDVWGYGNYGGTAYVYDGVIEMNSEGTLESNEYMTILVKFDKDTFNSSNVINDNFDTYLNMAQDGATKYKEENKKNILSIIIGIFSFLFNCLFWFFIVFIGIKASKNQKNRTGTKSLDFGETGKKVPKDVPNYRDIPFNKDIYRTYWISEAYDLNDKKTDFLGAILLKWLMEKKVSVTKTMSGLFKNKEETSINLTLNPAFDNDLEKELFDMMYKASKDGILESKEFEKWCSNNYSKILSWFDKIIDYETDKLIEEKKVSITEKTSLKIFKSKVYSVDSSMFEEAKILKGLKNFLEEFSRIDDKEAIEVNLWEYYLIYAQILGIAEKVAKQFKKLYPEILENPEYGYTYSDVIFIHNISYSGVRSATTSKQRAQSYSSGGGGFSSGGGGGGSFGGGSGGGGFR